MSPYVGLPFFHAAGQADDPELSALERRNWVDYQASVDRASIDARDIVHLSPLGADPAFHRGRSTAAETNAAIVSQLTSFRGTHAIVGGGLRYLDAVRAAVRERGELVASFAPWEVPDGEEPSD